jgi:oligoendopeptidase F
MDATLPPEWELGDLYASPDDPKLQADLNDSDVRAKTFAADYEGKLAGLSGAALGAAVQAYEALSEVLDRVGSYGSLLFAADTENPKVAAFYQNLNERITDISSHTLFFELELNQIDDATIAKQESDPKLGHYKPWLDANRAFKPYQLSAELEKLLHDKSVAGRSAWSRLFDETMAQLRFDYEGKKLSNSEILSLLSDRDGKTRKAAAKSFAKGLGDNIRLFALITNTLAKDKEIEDKWRKLPRPISRRNIGNQVEDQVVDALIAAVRAAYPETAHRYYKLKAKWFGVDKLDYWDRNAPLPEADDSHIDWSEARKTVLGSYNRFEPAMSEIADKFFERRWIDANPRPGKDSGAFSHPTVPSVHPYILMNFHGKSRDVMTLAHELGHGIHQTLAAPKGHFLSSTPLTLAETASVFGEMLTFRAMLDSAKDARQRRVMLASKVEDMLNTVVRQIAFLCFEERVHDERRKGELGADRLGEIWLDLQRESLGPAFRFDDEYKYFWSYIPHFIHSPFYVYAYAFGDCLVNSLYDVFEGGHPGFQKKYLEMLKAGGTLRHKELLAPFGLDASDPAFWRRGLSVVSRFIDELEKSL